MKPQYKTFSFKADDIQDEGLIRGFASTFGNIDLGDDLIDKGAFKKTLRENKGKVPILADHDPRKLIGYNVRAEEQDQGLFVEGKINLDTQLGRERFSLAKQALELGAPSGLSIGYMPIKAEPDKDRPAVRRLKEIKLFEYSLVTFPMNQEAMIVNAKSFAHGDIEISAKLFIETMFDKGHTKDDIFKALEKAAYGQCNPSTITQLFDEHIKQLKGEAHA